MLQEKRVKKLRVSFPNSFERFRVTSVGFERFQFGRFRQALVVFGRFREEGAP